MQALFLLACLALHYDGINAMEISNEINNNQCSSCLCHLCNIIFPTELNLQDHMRKHGGRKYNPFEKHVKRTHTHIKPHQCFQCSNAFTTKYELEQHHQTHNKTKPFFCKQCEQGFSRIDNLRTHNIKFHGEGKIYHQCTHKSCRKAFITPAGLAKHLKKIHPQSNDPVSFNNSLQAHHKIIPQNISPLLIETSPYYMPLEYSLFEEAIQRDLFSTYTLQLEWNNQ